ncbi:hypothetical protein RDABS01_029233 [Bienertia sinuspersici]
MAKQIQIAIIGAGTFVKNQYIPRLSEISNLVSIKYIWSRSEESARSAVELANKSFTEVECKWGDAGLDDIIKDSSVVGVAVVLAAQVQVDIALRLLKAGKHVIQEKPAVANNAEAEMALSNYNFISPGIPNKPIWAVAENYRFEPGFIEGRMLIGEIGDMMSVQVIVEGSMNSSNPYFSSSWRRNFTGGFILDMGVHMIAGLRMLVGCELKSVSALTAHIDTTLPPPDTYPVHSIQLENGCPGIFVMATNIAPQIFWRVVGLNGTVQVERGNVDGKHGYLVSKFNVAGQCTSSFHPFSGVTEELKTFLHDISEASSDHKPDPRLSFSEGVRDVAVLEAMLESGTKQGAIVPVKTLTRSEILNIGL